MSQQAKVFKTRSSLFRLQIKLKHGSPLVVNFLSLILNLSAFLFSHSLLFSCICYHVGAPNELDPGVITQEPSGPRPLSTTPKSRQKQPVRRRKVCQTSKSPMTPTRRSQRTLNLQFKRPHEQSKSGEPDLVYLED